MYPFQCDICGKSFQRKNSVSRHKRQRHSNENNFDRIDNNMIGGGEKEEIEPPSWTTPPSHHVLTPVKVTSGFPRIFCHVCDTAFTNKRAYKKHVKRYPSHKKSGADRKNETSLFQSGKLAADKIVGKGRQFMFNHPFCMQLVGPSRSGKTYWLSQLLRDRAQHIRPAPEKVLYCYTHWQPAYDLMQADGIEFHEGLPSSIYISSLSDCVLVLDDLMDVAVNDKKLMSLCTEGSHHKNISVVFIMQNLYPHGRESKTISLNMTYLTLFKMVRDKLQVQTLARQLFPGKTQEFMDYYHEMTSKPYGKLILDLHPRTPDSQRYIQDKVSIDNMNVDNDVNTSDSDGDEAVEFFKKQEARNNQVLAMTNPYLAAVLKEQNKIGKILQDPNLNEDEKAIHVTQAQRNSNFYLKNMNPVPPPATLIPPYIPAPPAATPTEQKPTLAGLLNEDIPFADLPGPTEEELRADSGDPNHMDNFTSLSGDEDTADIKRLQAKYNWKRRNYENRYHPVPPVATPERKEDIPFEHLPVPTQEERLNDSGDENHMENFSSLSDNEEEADLKKHRREYSFRKRNNENRFQPYY